MAGEKLAPSEREDRPAILVSYVYLDSFLKRRHGYLYRDWALDSGAFSAHNSGKEIRLQEYIDVCKRLKAEDATLTEVFALDVIGDWRASLRNAEEMWRQGVEAIPTFHPGEPESALIGMAKDYPKIALGGTALWNRDRKKQFLVQCFARVWPKKIHGFGVANYDGMMSVPFDSVDATSWETGTCRFGRWRAFGSEYGRQSINMSIRGAHQNLRAEIEYFMKLEKKVRKRWAHALGGSAPRMSLRLSVVSQSRMELGFGVNAARGE